MPDIDSAQVTRIYRAIRNKRWYDASSRRVLPVAFVLRAQEAGLSVLKAVGCSPQPDGCLAGLGTCFGEFVLRTEEVLALGLQVIEDEPDSIDFHENHAQILGIPTDRTTREQVKIAEDLASELAELSTLNYDRHNSYG